jgi:nickel-dependent lactate racemase
MIIKVSEVDEIIISLLFHCWNANIYYLANRYVKRQHLFACEISVY